ncbi:unnamed protein product [Caenorhabditis angaria]|uniref:Uncharacterized protein n=1 Tax=Caenorhabditis angaria TaxID=860376 RepID=A0A9P1J5N9_9PELO|nr:unnamed protein product [Caenorhabditis angaria]
MILKFFLFSLLFLNSALAFRTQSAGVKGRLVCGDKPVVGAHLKLFDEDNGPDPDDMLDQHILEEEENGLFQLSGSSRELTPIDPELRIYHDCNDHGSPCQREWVIRIPNKYITSGEQAEKYMDIGTLNLEIELDTKMRILVFLAVFLMEVTSIEIPEQHTGVQYYRVKGVLLCGDKPEKNVIVKLVDDDFGPDPDDDLAKGYTNENGEFELIGFTTELTTIDPHLKIYHDCNDGILPCQRRWKFELPNKYIYAKNETPKTLDIGTWNLESLLSGESRDCLH